MNKLIKSPCYIRESLWIISGQRRGSLSAEQNANEERGTGYKRTTSSSLCLEFCLIIALCKTLHLQSSITRKNSCFVLEKLSRWIATGKKNARTSQCSTSLPDCIIQMKTLNKGPCKNRIIRAFVPLQLVLLTGMEWGQKALLLSVFYRGLFCSTVIWIATLIDS